MAQVPKERIPLPKLMEAVLPHQATVYVTALNIIQCLALGFLVVELRTLSNENKLSVDCMWRSALALTVILAIWHRYVAESQYLWPMSWLDTLGPFSIGLAEFVMIFCLNAEKVASHKFVLIIVVLQFLAMSVYINVYFTRSSKMTERLYEEFYKDTPRFAFYLTTTLKMYSVLNMRMMGYFLAQTIVFMAFILVFPSKMYEMFFSMVCILTMIAGENLRGFHTYLTNSPILGDYFTKGGEP